MEDKEIFPAEGPGYFEGFLNNLKESTTTRDALWWVIVNQFGNELNQSIDQKKVTNKEAVGFKKEIGEFMEQGNNREEYERNLGEMATFWWEKKEAKKGK